MLAGQTASGDINPSRFVTKSGRYTVAQGTLGAVAIGISHEGSREVPLPGASSLAAVAGDPIRVYSDTENCLLEAGDLVADGAFLKSDSTGRGITAATTEKYYAVAESGGAAAGVKMQVIMRAGIVP